MAQFTTFDINKLCIDCKYIRHRPLTNKPECSHPQSPMAEVVYGCRAPCEHVRGCVNLCGPKGQWYQAMAVKPSWLRKLFGL